MRQGFTLIQISILLMIASLVLVNVLPATQTKLTNDSNANVKLNAMLTSLRQYQAANGYLPCPADASQPIGSTTYGVAAANGGASGNCTGGSPAANYTDTTNHVAIGMLPVHTLGLPLDSALDAYGRDITYAVDTNATACWSSSSLTGQISVTDNGAAYNTIAALISHGADGHGAWLPLTGSSGSAVRLNAGSTDADQLTNAHVDASFNPAATLTNFVRKAPTSTFDDLVVYKSPFWTLNNLPQSIPTISAITPPANGTYSTGQTLSFTVTFSTAVTVTGAPYLSLSAITGSIGMGNLAKATYQSGSGTTTLTFSYTVAVTDTAPTGLTMTSSITLGGGTISNGSACPMLGFTAPSLTGVIIGAQYVYATDENNNRVQEFNTSGTYLSQLGCASGKCTASGSNGKFSFPHDVKVDSSGNVWVADNNNNRVEKFNSSGTYQSQLGCASGACSTGSGNGQFGYVDALTIDSGGNIWVTDSANNRIQKFNSSGSYLLQAGSCSSGACTAGSGNGQFQNASHIATDASGNLYVTDQINDRVEVFNSSGSFLSKFGSPGSTNGTFSDPGGIAVDSSGNIWVVDENNNNVQKFNSSGSYLSQLGCASGACSSSTANGKFNSPDGIFIDSSGNVWVADMGNNRIQEFNTSGTFLMGIGAGYQGVGGTVGTTGTTGGKFNGGGGVAVGR